MAVAGCGRLNLQGERSCLADDPAASAAILGGYCLDHDYEAHVNWVTFFK